MTPERVNDGSVVRNPSLTDFLLARIADDEERARFVQREVARGRGPETFEAWRLSWHDEYDLLCIEPERALAECESKRRIVWRCTERLRWDDILEDLALPYADHPDYDESWRS